MNKATPEDVRQAQQAVQVLIDAGLDFVPIPVMDEDHKVALFNYGGDVLEHMAVTAEKEESK